MHGAHRGSVGMLLVAQEPCRVRRRRCRALRRGAGPPHARQRRSCASACHACFGVSVCCWAVEKRSVSDDERSKEKTKRFFCFFARGENGRGMCLFFHLPQRRKFKKSQFAPVSSTNAACTRRVAGVRAAGWGCACDGGAPFLRRHHGVPRRRQGESSRLSLLLLLRRHTPQRVVCRQPCCQCLVSPHAGIRRSRARGCSLRTDHHFPAASVYGFLHVFPTEL